MTHSQRLLVAVAVALVAGGCVGDRATGPRPPQNAAQQPGLPVLSRNGILVPQAQMRSRLAAITRDVAIALADPQLRATVYSELRGSPYREHKIYFGGFLRNSGRSLLNALAGLRQGTTAGVLATLDSVVDLEFYMPVKEHFVTWTGGRDLIVDSALRDDGRVPFGFDLTGQPVALSAAEPPPTPTLVLVPVETDFSRIPAPPPANVNAAMSTIPGVYMTREVVYDDHEGWPNGAPEFEVHLFQTDVDMEYIDVICAGEAQTLNISLPPGLQP